MDFLKQEANSIISNYNLNSEINQIKSNFKKTPGNYYYLYQTNNQKTISLIAPHEWTNYDSFIAKVFLDYDFNNPLKETEDNMKYLYGDVKRITFALMTKIFSEREILEKFYYATNGPNWNCN